MIVLRYLWIVGIILTLVQLRWIWTQIQPRIAARPELEAGYRSLYHGLWVAMNVPWALMGLGILSGRVSSVQEYLMPSEGNPVVVAWWGAMGVLALGTTGWVFAGGAEKLAKVPGFPMIPIGSAARIKQAWLVALGWNLVMAGLVLSGFPFKTGAPPAWWPASVAREALILPVVLVGFPAISFLLASISGWGSLAERYRYDSTVDRKRSMCSGSFGAMQAKNMLTIGGDDSGLYLAVLLPFRIAHPPLKIPWADLRGSPLTKYGISFAHLEVVGDPVVTMDLRTADLRVLFQGQSLPEQLQFLEGGT